MFSILLHSPLSFSSPSYLINFQLVLHDFALKQFSSLRLPSSIHILPSYFHSPPSHSTNRSFPHLIDNPLSVSTIATSGIDAYSSCRFYTSSTSTLVGGVNRGGSIGVGPPQSVYAVSCKPTPGAGSSVQCLPVYCKLTILFIFFWRVWQWCWVGRCDLVRRWK